MWAYLQSFWHWWILVPWKTWLDYTDKTVRIVAVILGGVWAYVKFARGRIFHKRLEPTVSGRCFRDKQGDYVIAAVKLKNVGASRADLQKRGTVLIVNGCARAKDSSPERPVDWNRLTVKSIFEYHAGVEPSETIEDSVMVDLPADLIAVRLEVRVVVSRGLLRKNIEFNVNTIIEAPAEESSSGGVSDTLAHGSKAAGRSLYDETNAPLSDGRIDGREN